LIIDYWLEEGTYCTLFFFMYICKKRSNDKLSKKYGVVCTE
jgi:hypothetical protein